MEAGGAAVCRGGMAEAAGKEGGLATGTGRPTCRWPGTSPTEGKLELERHNQYGYTPHLPQGHTCPQPSHECWCTGWDLGGCLDC